MLDNVEDQADYMNLVFANKGRQRIEVNDSTRDAGALVSSQGFDLEAEASRGQRLQRQEALSTRCAALGISQRKRFAALLALDSSLARVPVFIAS